MVTVGGDGCRGNERSLPRGYVRVAMVMCPGCYGDVLSVAMVILVAMGNLSW